MDHLWDCIFRLDILDTNKTSFERRNLIFGTNDVIGWNPIFLCVEKYFIHLIDILDPNDSYSVSIFQDQAKEIIARLKDRNILPILSGGTGLYVQSLLENYNFNDVKPDEYLRAELDELYSTKGIEGLRDYAFTLGKEHNIEIPYPQRDIRVVSTTVSQKMDLLNEPHQ